MDFYLILNEIMREKKLSIADIAKQCDLPDSTVRSIIDRKQKRIALDVAFKIHKELNISLERLNGEKISPEPTKAGSEDTEKWLTDLLVERGYIHAGEDISDRDAEFLIHWTALLDAWFSEH